MLNIALYFSERKLACQIVYKPSLNKVAITTGVIRDVFSKQSEEFILLENGLPIPIVSILSITVLEQSA